MKFKEIANNMNIYEFIKLLTTLGEDELIYIINTNQVFDLNDELFKILFLKSNLKVKELIIQNKDLFKRVMNLKPNINGKTILELADDDTIDLIIKSPYSKEYTLLISSFLAKINMHKYDHLTKKINFLKIIDDNSYLKNQTLMTDYLINKGFDEILIKNLIVKINQGLISPLAILKLKNNGQLLVLTKFNTLVETSFDNNIITFKKGYEIPYDLLNNLNNKHLLSLYNMLKEKNPSTHTDNILCSIKLYSIFGYDNASKIIRDYFTFLTESSINRIVDTSFKDFRRAYRLDNQDKFYYYGLEDRILEELQNDTINLAFFKDFSDNPEELINELIINVRGKKINIQRKIIEKIIIEQIILREQKNKLIFSEKTHKRISKKKTRYPITASELIILLNDVDLTKTKLDSKGQVIPNKELNNFLLGTTKKDNDALLRLVINKEGFGLNESLPTIINHFDEIDKIAKKSNLSTNSILDVIDICKTNLYHMVPDFCDVTLETLAKIINSKEHINETEDEIIKKAYSLHKRRKAKIYGTIPMICGFYNDTYYEVAPYDAEYLLCAGIDAGNCLKIGGKGEDLFEYCLTDVNGALINLTDIDGNKYNCPLVRSGNGIHGNGIDPEPSDDKKEEILKAIQACLEKIAIKSNSLLKDPTQTIQVATLTDLHMKGYMDNYPKYNLKKGLPLNKKIYCDYNKPEINNYILYKSDTYQEDLYYLSDDRYFQKRNPIFRYNNLGEWDKERISIIINSIAYSAIDFSSNDPIYDRMHFKHLDINDFSYIIGNKDWFIAIKNDLENNNFEIISHLLPYDNRASHEYYRCYDEIQNILIELSQKEKKL